MTTLYVYVCSRGSGNTSLVTQLQLATHHISTRTALYLTCVGTVLVLIDTDVIRIVLLCVHKIRIHKPDTISIRVDIVFCNKTRPIPIRDFCFRYRLNTFLLRTVTNLGYEYTRDLLRIRINHFLEQHTKGLLYIQTATQ